MFMRNQNRNKVQNVLRKIIFVCSKISYGIMETITILLLVTAFIELNLIFASVLIWSKSISMRVKTRFKLQKKKKKIRT